MSLFSDRRYDINIDGKPIFKDGGGAQQLRVTFQIEVSYDGSFAHADIALYNLADNTINKFYAQDAVIGLSAGYVGNQDIIFSGGIKNVLSQREGPNTITRILANSGAVRRVSLNYSMPTGSTVPQTIRKIGEIMGLPVVINEADFSSEAPYQRKSLQGDAVQALQKMGYAHGFGTVEENGKIVVLKNGSVRKHKKFLISQETGMEGIPEITNGGADVAVRINPQIVIGSEIEIKSELKSFNMGNLYYRDIEQAQGSGIYTAWKMDHSGDSWGDAWTTKITGKRLSAK